jgi:hypothetical protein
MPKRVTVALEAEEDHKLVHALLVKHVLKPLPCDGFRVHISGRVRRETPSLDWRDYDPTRSWEDCGPILAKAMAYGAVVLTGNVAGQMAGKRLCVASSSLMAAICLLALELEDVIVHRDASGKLVATSTGF